MTMNSPRDLPDARLSGYCFFMLCTPYRPPHSRGWYSTRVGLEQGVTESREFIDKQIVLNKCASGIPRIFHG